MVKEVNTIFERAGSEEVEKGAFEQRSHHQLNASAPSAAAAGQTFAARSVSCSRLLRRALKGWLERTFGGLRCHISFTFIAIPYKL